MKNQKPIAGTSSNKGLSCQRCGIEKLVTDIARQTGLCRLCFRLNFPGDEERQNEGTGYQLDRE